VSDKAKILVQLDTDPLPSVFDRVVAIDAGADHVFAYGGVTPDKVRDLVYGCLFTRGANDLRSTAIFIGGSDVNAGEKLLAEVRKAIIPQYGLNVSVLLDSNGANTTAAAAVRAAARHLNLANTPALVLGGTGPVGQRVARLLARAGADVRIGSRQKDRAEAVCDVVRRQVPGANVEAVATATSADGPAALSGRVLVVAAGAAGVVLLPKKVRNSCATLQVAIDLNAVPPTGIEGIDVTDAGVKRDGVVSYGALGVGGTKMKIHKAAIAKLFERNDSILDAEEVYELAQRF
jgi:methylenetetrahydrofolate/methylenetetrahydromethanopterin dehydrogenase (NADP+)